jgi:hypothetical protein
VNATPRDGSKAIPRMPATAIINKERSSPTPGNNSDRQHITNHGSFAPSPRSRRPRFYCLRIRWACCRLDPH